MYLSASEAACLAWVRYNKLMFTLPLPYQYQYHIGLQITMFLRCGCAALEGRVNADRLEDQSGDAGGTK